MQSLEGQYDDCTEQVFEVGLKLEQKEKVIRTKLLNLELQIIRYLRSCSLVLRPLYWQAYNSAESDVGGLTRRALLIEEEVERSEERLAKAVTELCIQFHRADAAIKKRQQLENQNRYTFSS